MANQKSPGDRADHDASASCWYDQESKPQIYDIETEAYSQAQVAAESNKKPKGGKR